jgi:hypothetical protein
MGTGSFSGVKRPGRGADHPSPPSTKVKNEWSYTSTFIAMAKAAINKNRALFTRKIDLELRKKLVKCYI